MTGRWAALLLSGAVLALGGLSLRLGQDVNFDLLNYHYYDGYAFLHGRLSRDIAPAGIQTFQPPLLYAFEYLGIANLPPRVFGFLSGVLQGLNVPVLFLLGLAVVSAADPREARAIALVTALLGGIGPAAIALLGTTFGDNVVSIPALLGLAVVLRSTARHPGGGPSLRAVFGSGVLAGVATGLKLTMGTYHVALLAAVALVLRRQGQASRGLVAFAAGSVLGFVPTGGFWSWILFQRFGNPVFPWANGLFGSEYFKPENFRLPWMARTPYDILRPAVDLALGHAERFQEVGLRDGRFLLVLAASGVCLALMVFRPVRGRLGWPDLTPLSLVERAFLAYWFTAYFVWVRVFYYYRYLAPLEFTAPLTAFVLMRRFVPRRHFLRVALTMAVVLALTTRSESWGRRPWQESRLELPIPPAGLQPNSLVLLVGQPISYAIPSFREDARFILVTLDEFGETTRWKQRIAELVARHRGPFLLLSTFGYSRAAAEERAAELGLRVSGPCEPTGRGPYRLRLCELAREP
jgi:hypothetical protein